MDHSTEGVTLHSGFILTIVEQCKGMERICAPLFDMVRHIDPKAPRVQAPIALYNEVCAWVEKNLGVATIRSAGEVIGRNAFRRMCEENELTDTSTPIEALEALVKAVRKTIRDPRGRGWEILDAYEGRVIMRRTQTFNCIMQEGVLLAFLHATNTLMPRVEHMRCVRRGDEFCDYELRWLAKRSSRMIPAAPKV